LKILLLGANGQVGWELQRSLTPLGEIKVCSRKEADLEDLVTLKKLIQAYQPEVIVNAAAYTAVDLAEAEPEKAYRINTEAVATIATEARQINALLIHYSTDYIFDGTKATSYTEQDLPNPQSVYGKTKQKGEQAIKESEVNHLIFRTSWVYSKKGKNFVNTIIKLAQEREELNIINDQIGIPTSATLIADITSLAIYKLTQHPDKMKIIIGTYNLVPTGETSWYNFSKLIIRQVQQQTISLHHKIKYIKINPVTTDQYPQTAKRPKNSRLNNKKIQETFNIHLPTWQQQLKYTIQEIFACPFLYSVANQENAHCPSEQTVDKNK
jgi:dTDP-4-dehydrorhamnose reductase